MNWEQDDREKKKNNSTTSIGFFPSSLESPLSCSRARSPSFGLSDLRILCEVTGDLEYSRIRNTWEERENEREMEREKEREKETYTDWLTLGVTERERAAPTASEKRKRN